jgi:hypothetical protein
MSDYEIRLYLDRIKKLEEQAMSLREIIQILLEGKHKAVYERVEDVMQAIYDEGIENDGQQRTQLPI